MSTERPFKSFRSPDDRPFKTYQAGHPFYTSSAQLPEASSPGSSSRSPQSPPRLPPTLTSSLPSTLHAMAQQPPLSMGGQHGLQVYGDPDDFSRMAPGGQAGGAAGNAATPLINIDASLNQYYSDLDLDDQESPLMRQDLLVSGDSLMQQAGGQQQRDMAPATSSSAPVPSFLVPNRSLMRGLNPSRPSINSAMGLQESLSALFDQPSASMYSQPHGQLGPPGQNSALLSRAGMSTLPSSQAAPYLLPNSSASPVSPVSQGRTPSNGGRAPTNGGGPPNGNGSLNFLVKQEADEGHAVELASTSPDSIHSPVQTGGDVGSTDTPAGRSLKRHISEVSMGGDHDHPSTSAGGINGNGNVASCTSTSLPACSSPSESGEEGKLKAENKDPAYLEKRRKNNESAKRSREARRNKEELVALRVVALEEENMRLRAESSLLERELDELRHRLFQ